MYPTGGSHWSWIRIMSWRRLLTLVTIILIVVLLGSKWVSVAVSLRYRLNHRQQCRCFPGDTCWPSRAEWDSFNETIGDKLIATVPIASACHDTFPGVSFDAEKCYRIRMDWARPAAHYSTAHSPMAPSFANLSCDPFTARDAQCIVGTYVPYAVNASGVSDYRAAIAFAERHNIRLVIRNTGHDYMGKSTGPGALAIWTHNIKDRSVLDYHSPAYSGKAMKVGAGVQVFEAQELANSHGLVVVGGGCSSVGLAGGYTQGGGTSPLSSALGLAADQVLEWEVITAAGHLLKATPTENADLYWALSGGGGGTFGIVLSMTIKLHPDMPTAGASLRFQETTDAFWEVVRIFLINLPAVLAAGGTAYWAAIPESIFDTSQSSLADRTLFDMPQVYLPNGTSRDLERLFRPTLKSLEQNNVSYSFSTREFPTFQNAFDSLLPEMYVSEVNLGGRLIPRSLVASDKNATALTDAIRFITRKRGVFGAVSLDVNREPSFPNAAHPAWRETLFLAFVGIIYDRYNQTANHIGRQTVTELLMPALTVLTPGGAAYLNEADINQRDWQNVFYGANYARLLSIKQKYDPHGVFWGKTAVGSEGWDVTANGRLCKSLDKGK